MKTKSENVLNLLKKVPGGKITTYGELAKAAGTSPRAVGQILSRNKDPIRYPCYKVIKSDGSIGGFFGTNKNDKKIRLLRKDGIKIKDGKVDLEKYLYRF